jgi:hypothetical protein
MISFAGGVDGIKILGNLGGLPALFIIGGSMLSLFKMKEMLTGAPVAAHEHDKDESPVPFESEFAK